MSLKPNGMLSLAHQQVIATLNVQSARLAKQRILGIKLCIIPLALMGLLALLPKPVMAQANCQNVACVTTGPRLASVDAQQNALLNAALSDLTGTPLTLSLVDANGLAQGNIGTAALLNELQSELNVGSPADVLTTDVTLAQLLHAMAQVSNDTATVNALNALAATPNLPTATLQLGDLLQADTGNGTLSNVNLNALDLVVGSVELFNHDNVVTTPTPVTISGNDLGLGGVIHSITLRAQVIEPPVFICGKAGAQFYSAGLRLSLAIDLVDTKLVTTNLQNALQSALGGLVTVDVDATLGQLDLYVDVARGTGTISQIDAVKQAVTIQATPGVTDLYLGKFQDAVFFDRNHVISPTVDLDFAQLGTLVITVTTAGIPTTSSAAIEVKSYANGTNPGPITLNFTGPYPQTKTATTSATFTTDLVTDLVNHLQIKVNGSLGVALDPLLNTIILPNLTSLLKDAINNDTLSIPTLLTNVVDPLLSYMGMGLGEMDVTVNGIAQVCDTDNDGLLDPVDSDDDGDGIADVNEGNGTVDTDHDGTPDSLDQDSDGDHVPDAVEAFDANHDGQADQAPSGKDANHNGLDDAFEASQGGVVAPLPDTDADGKPDFQDVDDDGDGINTVSEDPNGNGNPRDDDTDHDGRPDYLDPANANPCLPNANVTACTAGDTDGDGVTNGNDPAPTNPCVPNANALACTTGDTDGDGVTNGNDPAPTNPCVPNANAAACANDTDGDGTPNSNDPAPSDPCIPNANAVACATGDTDGDGVANGNDPAPLNPCVPNANAAACTTGDTDHDGTPNGSDPAPLNPCVPNANALACTTGDTDGDGTLNGTDPEPTNPCVPNANAIACTTGDADGDGTLNGGDPAPTNPCVPNANTTACLNDTDGDGTPNATDPTPTNPCVPNPNAAACTTGDADGDGVPNSTDPAPLNPCSPNPSATACTTGDSDNDGTPNASDPGPTDPCIPDPNSVACQVTAGAQRKLYLPAIYQGR